MLMTFCPSFNERMMGWLMEILIYSVGLWSGVAERASGGGMGSCNHWAGTLSVVGKAEGHCRGDVICRADFALTSVRRPRTMGADMQQCPHDETLGELVRNHERCSVEWVPSSLPRLAEAIQRGYGDKVLGWNRRVMQMRP